MDEIFTHVLLVEYNKNFANYIVFGCPCYAMYENFNDAIFVKKKSYLCCLIVTVGNVYKIMHTKWPIMLGSLIDTTIRPLNIRDQNVFGCFIINGVVKMIYNFITNNLTNGHVRRTKKDGEQKIFVMKLKQKNISMSLTYNPNRKVPLESHVYDEIYTHNENLKRKFDVFMEVRKEETTPFFNPTLTATASQQQSNTGHAVDKSFRKTRMTFNEEYVKDLKDMARNRTWISFINSVSPYAPECFTEAEYIAYFDMCLKHAPLLDDLANKTCLSPNAILLRVLEYLIKNVENGTKGDVSARLTTMNTRLVHIINNGNMFFVLCAKQDTKVMNDFKNIYQTVDAQKLHLASTLSSTIKRAISNSVMNSKALLFPRDGYFFMCTIDTKDIKGAGENIALAQLTISPRGISIEILNKLLRDSRLAHDPSDTVSPVLTIVVNSFLTRQQIQKSKLVFLKRKCCILPLMIYGNYLIINVNGYTIMKYSFKYRFFVTPFEHEHLWPDAFEDYHEHLKYTPCAMFLPSTIELAQPAKRNVANSNLKGRCALLNTKFNVETFLFTIGASNAALIHTIEDGDETISCYFHNEKEKLTIPIDIKDVHMRYLKLAIADKAQPMPAVLKELFMQYQPIDDETESYGMALCNIIDDVDTNLRNMLNDIYFWYNDTFLFTTDDSKMLRLLSNTIPLLPLTTASYNTLRDISAVCSGNRRITLKGKSHLHVADNTTIKKNYLNKIKINPTLKHPPHFTLWAGFGDVSGGTNEDGIILDKCFVENGPQKLISQTLTVKFEETIKVLKRDRPTGTFPHFIYKPMNKIVNHIITFGVVLSPVKLTVTKSKNINVEESRVKATHRYFISTILAINHAKVVESHACVEKKRISIHFRYMCRLGVGTKLSTLHGQKGIVSLVTDLSEICAFTRDGHMVHPQILFSVASVVGRTVSSQIMSMLTQKNLAFTETGVVVASQGINVHHIEASMKSKFSVVKNDLMAEENGFISNEMSFTSKILRQQGSIDLKKHPLHLIQQLLKMQSVSLHMLAFDYDTLTFCEEAL